MDRQTDIRHSNCSALLHPVWRGFLFWIILSIMTTYASAQEWQSYQLTNFPPYGQVRQCGSVADSLGHIHHFLICALGPTLNYLPVYYMRTDFQGRILTDTVRLNPGLQWTAPVFTGVVGDGGRAWCVWSDKMLSDSMHNGFFLTSRNADGGQSLPRTLVCDGAPSGGPPLWGFSAALRTQDSTIHMVTEVHYYRITTAGDTVLPRKWIDGWNAPVDPEIRIGPDGTPWAAMRNDIGGMGDTDILLVRFGEDSSQTTYHPFTGDVHHWYVHDFGIDAAYDFHFLVSSDTGFGYYRLDSSMVIRETHVLEPDYAYFATMKTDSAGSCLFVWDQDPGLKWAYRHDDGTWPHEPASIDPTLQAASAESI
jgi:hypothetical protein